MRTGVPRALSILVLVGIFVLAAPPPPASADYVLGSVQGAGAYTGRTAEGTFMTGRVNVNLFCIFACFGLFDITSSAPEWGKDGTLFVIATAFPAGDIGFDVGVSGSGIGFQPTPPFITGGGFYLFLDRDGHFAFGWPGGSPPSDSLFADLDSGGFRLDFPL